MLGAKGQCKIADYLLESYSEDIVCLRIDTLTRFNPLLFTKTIRFILLPLNRMNYRTMHRNVRFVYFLTLENGFDIA